MIDKEEFESLDADALMLKGITTIIHSRKTVNKDFSNAQDMLRTGIHYMNASIIKDSFNTNNRIFRLKYYLGITKSSSETGLSSQTYDQILSFVKEDLLFLEENFSNLNSETRSFYYFSKAELALSEGKKEEAVDLLNKSISIKPESVYTDCAKILLELTT